jgi:Protein of unknown function (DUF3253)
VSAPPGTEEIRAAILRMSDERAPRTFGTSDVARALAADWRPLMDAVRAETTTLADEGIVDVVQGGLVVDAHTAGEAVRVRRARPPQ